MQAAGSPTRRCERRFSRRASSSFATLRMAIDLTTSCRSRVGRTGQRPQLPRARQAVHETHMETFDDSWEHTHEPYDEWAHWMLERPVRSVSLAAATAERRDRRHLALPSARDRSSDAAGSTSSASAGPGGVGPRAGAPVRVVPPARAHGCTAPFSASTRRASPVRIRSTRVPACSHLDASTSTSCRREPPPRPLSRLPHADRGRGRPGVPVPLAAAASSAPASSASRAPGATGGEAMAEAAFHALPYPEASVIEADTLAEQTLMLASELPDRPIVLGGCCCSHVGAIEALSAGEECLAVVWIDAHGDLNTPASSPSGNAWGMPLRMVLDDGAVLAKHVALDRCPQPRSAGGRVHRVGGCADRRRRGRARARRSRRGLRRARLRLRRAGRARRLHAGAGGPAPRRARGAARAMWPLGSGSPASASPGSCAIRRTSRSSRGSRPPWAYDTAFVTQRL